MNHYKIMFFVMIFSGLLSTMNVWVDTIDDIRLSLNDLYMILLMTGWMFLLMGILYKDIYPFLFGGVLVILNIWCIRTQYMITNTQYRLGMIPHHSMAVHMSKQLLKNDSIKNKKFIKNIIESQQQEIEYMKQTSQL
jgi:hypothetical protein